jgi:hypothetical protein
VLVYTVFYAGRLGHGAHPTPIIIRRPMLRIRVNDKYHEQILVAIGYAIAWNSMRDIEM